MLEKIDNRTFKFKITCSAGTYIRALCRDLANKLGSCATMIKLIRTKSGPFEISSSVKLEDLTYEEIENNLIPLSIVLQEFDKVEIPQKVLKDLLDGKKVLFSEILKNNINSIQIKNACNYLVLCNNQIIGIANIENNYLKIKTYLCDNFSF